jgi:hypothetical protein
MHRAIMFNGIWTFTVSILVFFFRGRQVRRELDEQMNEENKVPSMGMSTAMTSPSSNQREHLEEHPKAL